MKKVDWKQLFGIKHTESLELQQDKENTSRYMSMVFTPILIAFAIYNIAQNHNLLGFLEMIIAGLFVCFHRTLFKTNSHICPYTVAVLISILSMTAFMDGGIGQMSLLWLIITPFIYFNTLSQRWSWIFSNSMLFMIIILNTSSLPHHTYSAIQMLIFATVFELQTLLAAFMSYFRDIREQQLITLEQHSQKQCCQTEARAKDEAYIWQHSIDCIDDAMLILDHRGRILKSNHAAKQIEPEIIQQSNVCCYQLLQNRDHKCDSCPLKKSYQANQNLTDEIFIESIQKWFMVSIYPIQKKHSEKHQSLMILKDITPKHHQENIRNQELFHLQSMHNISNIISASKDTHTILLNLMTAIRTVFKADRAWVISPCNPQAKSFSVPLESTSDAYPGAFVGMQEMPIDAEISKIFQAALDSKDPITFPSMPTLKFVKKYSIQSQMIFAIHSHVGEPWLLGIHQCAFATDWDETQRQLFKEMGIRLSNILDAWRLNDTLDRRTDQYKQLVENMPDAVIILLKEKIVFANEVMLHITGEETIEHIKGKNLSHFIHGDSPPIRYKELESHAHDKRTPIHAIKLCHKDGSVVDIISSSMSISYHGKPAVQMILRDVTRRNQVDQALKKALHQNKKQASQLIRVQERQRISIAQNLHDDSGQLLTAMSVNLQSIKNNIQDKKALSRIEDSEIIVSKLFDSIRASLKTLNPTHIDTLGLAAAIQSDINDWSHRHNITITANMPARINTSNPETATTIFRIIQEALTNIAKHAKADHVWLSIEVIYHDSPRIFLQVKDNGCGFHTEQSKPDSYGLFGMQSRTELVSGWLNIDSQIGVGTTLQAEFPIYPKEQPMEL